MFPAYYAETFLSLQSDTKNAITTSLRKSIEYSQLKQGAYLYHPNATSSTIISENPTAKKIVPILECSPADISGMSSSTTT